LIFIYYTEMCHNLNPHEFIKYRQCNRLALPVHLISILTLPACTTRPTNCLAVSVSLAQSTRLLIGRREATHLSVLVHWVDYPLNVRVAANGLVVRVSADYFKELVGRVLSHPIAVENTKSPAFTANTLLSNGLQRTLVLELINTNTLWLAVHLTLWHGLLATSTANTHTVDHPSLFGLVAKPARLVRPSRSRGAMNSCQLTVLPAANPQQKTHHITLLLTPQLLLVLVHSHLI